MIIKVKSENSKADIVRQRDYMDYTKTDRFLILLHKISHVPKHTLLEDEVREILGNPSRAQFYKMIKELCEEVGERPALLKKIEGEDASKYTLAYEFWINLLEAEKENIYLLKSYRQLGYLLPESELQKDLLSGYADFDRKFYYLAPIRAKQYSEIQNQYLEQIIKSLVASTKLLLHYDGKTVNIFPLTLCQYRDDLYLLAYKNEMREENYRTYKVSRIEKLESLVESFKYPLKSKWNPDERFKLSSGVVIGIVKECEFKVFGTSKELLSEKRFFSTLKFESNAEFDQYLCQYTNLEEFVGQLFVYGQDIELISGDEVREKFLEKANAILRRNRI